MTTTTTAALAQATACEDVYQLPTTDAACGASLHGNMGAVFDECCKGNGPVTYDHHCGIYCLAQGQTVHELSTCLMSNSHNYGGIFCNDAENATASTPATTTNAQATAATATLTGAAASSASAAAEGESNAAAVLPRAPVSKAGLGAIAVLFSSVILGAFV